jgi:hypothetical protein
MAKYREVGVDHKGNELTDGVSGQVRTDDGSYTGYRVRWREEDGDGIERQPSCRQGRQLREACRVVEIGSRRYEVVLDREGDVTIETADHAYC